MCILFKKVKKKRSYIKERKRRILFNSLAVNLGYNRQWQNSTLNAIGGYTSSAKRYANFLFAFILFFDYITTMFVKVN